MLDFSEEKVEPAQASLRIEAARLDHCEIPQKKLAQISLSELPRFVSVRPSLRTIKKYHFGKFSTSAFWQKGQSIKCVNRS